MNETHDRSLNSEGLPNYGIEYYTSDDAVAASADKPYFVSLSGKTLEDNLAMLEIVSKIKGVDAIELNVACPNVIGHPIIGYDFDQFQDVLESLARHPDVRKKPLGLKLPPYLDFQHFKKVAEMINKCNFVRYVACINTMGNALVVDAESEQPLIRPKGGFGGLSGPSVKYTALANVKKLRELLRSDIDVVGVGGIRTFYIRVCEKFNSCRISTHTPSPSSEERSCLVHALESSKHYTQISLPPRFWT